MPGALSEWTAVFSVIIVFTYFSWLGWQMFVNN
jgi:hypothetical protein